MSPKSARRTLDAPVRRVTVMEDRAFVRREVHLDAEPGPLKLRVDVAPVLVDKTLDVRAEGATLAEARVRRERLHRHTERGDVGLREKLREAIDALKDLEEAMARDTAELADIRRARELLVSEIGEEVAWGQGDPARWTSDFEAATERAEALRVALAEAHAERDRLRRERDDLSARVRAVATPARDEAAWLDLDLHLEAAGSVAITIGYLVPNALWRPQHRATHVPGEGAKVRLETHACVWQNTGEDWEDAELAFSTERPSLGVEPPPLETDRLTVKRKAEHVEVEAREQVVATSGLGRAEAEAPEVPGVDDGGEALELRAAHPANVPSDGRPHRVRLSEAEL
ncbi:MAG TPA: DUF4139 domain-containing protein, partial [Polyangiaceae bacterium LLY-WYZ-15_(1-7)]|nr:DUF4139 domain-containing protein [Polyangiaceae bacterium LLY-WYZ-15_(1-7)]